MRRLLFLTAVAFATVAAAQVTQLRSSGAASSSAYEKWLNEDVTYIIAPQERATFLQLQTNEEREHFVEQFWSRRDPDPTASHNRFKEEHYRRLAYANEHFASDVAGWKTDRGRTYIVYGPPKSIETSPRAVGRHASQLWRYTDRSVRFVDSCDCGGYIFDPLK